MLNPLPTTSLSKLMPSGAEPLSMERVMATIMSAFEQMWDNFVENAGSWEPFKDLYLNRWLHSYVPHVPPDFAPLNCRTQRRARNSHFS